ncbi:hypothetical protein HMI55_005291 [Coelomomyces lativittatus]|nr:hypothetical protein HMI55_005291 [Coelomomyces lativittatus]KAJ1503911.1 hypothetical protein HMI56_001893 [Coelomomyces lativittatus]
MSTTSPLLSSEAIDLWNRLRNVFSKLDEAHVLQDSHLRSAYPLHEELVKSANVSSKDTSRWRDAISEYKLALEALKQEAHYLTIAQSSLAELHSMLYPGDVGSVSKQGPDSKKLKKRLSSTDLKRPQVTFPTIPIQLGSDVAVRTTDETSDKYERYEWIWARVVSMKGSSYEVEDIDNKKYDPPIFSCGFIYIYIICIVFRK